MSKTYLDKILGKIKIPKQVTGLSKKDKRMLLIMLIFFIIVGYYMGILLPLEKEIATAKKNFQKESEKLIVTKSMISNFLKLKKESVIYKDIMQIIQHSSMMPYESAPLDMKIKAIVGNGRKCNVQISSIRPMNLIVQEEAGMQTTFKAKIFDIEGSGDMNSIIKYLRSLWGTELENITISTLSNKDFILRFSVKIIFLPKIIKRESRNDERYVYRQPDIQANPFDIVKPVILSKTNKLPLIKPIHLKADLIGIVESNGKRSAVIMFNDNRDVQILIEGEKVREHMVKKINLNEIIFEDKNKLQTKKKLPEDDVAKIKISV
jgi:hypothetical protein